MMPRALALPEDELLPLLDAAIRAGCSPRDFVEGLRRLLPGPAAARAAAAAPGRHRWSRSRVTSMPSSEPERASDWATGPASLPRPDAGRALGKGARAGSRWRAWAAASSTGGTRRPGPAPHQRELVPRRPWLGSATRDHPERRQPPRRRLHLMLSLKLDLLQTLTLAAVPLLHRAPAAQADRIGSTGSTFRPRWWAGCSSRCWCWRAATASSACSSTRRRSRC